MKNNKLETLDILNICSFVAQLQNMEEDNQNIQWIHRVIQAISEEIQKLHYENELIMEKIDTILNELKKKE